MTWKTMVDNLVTKDTTFEKIYEYLTNELQFHSPSKKELVEYLSKNYEKKYLWTNLWSRKGD